MAVSGLIAADRLADQGIAVTVVDPRWTKPVDPALAGLARRARLVVTVEDNGLAGGFGDAVARLLRDEGVAVPLKTFGIPQRFLAHGTRDEVLDEIGLAPQHLARQITEAVARLDQERDPAPKNPGPPPPRRSRARRAPASSRRPGRASRHKLRRRRTRAASPGDENGGWQQCGHFRSLSSVPARPGSTRPRH